MKKIFSIMLACLLAVCFMVPALAEPEGYVFDWAEMLTDAAAIEAYSAEIYKETGVAIAVVLVDGAADPSETAIDVWDNYVDAEEGAILSVNTEVDEYIIGLMGELSEISDDQYRELCNAYVVPDTYQQGVEDFILAVCRLIDAAPATAESETENKTEAEAQEGITQAAEDEPEKETQLQQEAEKLSFRLVVDEANVLTNEQAEMLSNHAEAIGRQYPYDVVIYFAESLHQRDAQALADDFFDYNGYGVGNDRSGIILMICPSQREYAFSTRGDGYQMFDGARFSALDDATLDDMRSGDWYQAAEDYLSVCEHYFAIGMPEEPEPLGPLRLLPFCLITGFILALIPMGGMKRKLKSVAMKREASGYVEEGSVDITRREDRFVNMVVTRTPIQQQSSSSDGGRGTHVSSSGATHGGHSGKF